MDLLEMEGWAAELLNDVPKQVIGARIRRERTAQGVSLRDLAAKAKVGVNSVVRLESGSDFRLTTLVKVCSALGLHLDRLVGANEAAVAIHRASDNLWHELDSYGTGPLSGGRSNLTEDERRAAVARTGKNPLMLLKSRLSTGKLLPTLIEIHHPTEARSHPGEEFVYVLSGMLLLNVAGEEFVLRKGESAEFWGTEPHSYAPEGDPCLILSLRVSP